ncbi:CD48 antigen-like isoform X3 [Pimephales promelas]|uniref:CD48 antigen-like isoform X3 n=1 Tax=Pimephales promelas TaxID=90988 RepID=UPI001955B014|nr:CD48 antigen-like isoform X3 [Pimephales promelas]
MEFIHLLTLFMTTLSSTASRSRVFVQTGDSVILDIQNKALPQCHRFVWTNDKSKNVVRFVNQSGNATPHSLYKDRVDFNMETFSLSLKNMQKTDSGLYTAKTIGEKETIVAEHNVSVIDPVESPVLNWNATMISVNSCIANVSCNGYVLTLSTSYHSNNCSQAQVTSSEMLTLTLHCIENIVVCNYSNPVSWKNDTIEINQLCTPHELNSRAHEENNQTIYAQVQPKIKEQRPLEMLEKSANPETVYGVTGEHKHTHNTSQNRPSPEIRAEVQTENPPSTTYSTIGQHQKTSLPNETDNTIYSVVRKSSKGRQLGHS